MRPTALHRLAAAAAVLVLLGSAACGGSSAGGSDGASASETASPSEGGGSSADAGTGEYPYDLSDPGDDLLVPSRRGVVISGTDTEMSWQWPASFEVQDAQQATNDDGDATFTLTTGAKPDGTDPESEAESTAAQAGDGVESQVYEVTVGDREFWVATVDAGEGSLSLRAFFHSPEGQQATYAVLLTSGAGLGEVPDERVDELHQMVASLELEPSDSTLQ